MATLGSTRLVSWRNRESGTRYQLPTRQGGGSAATKYEVAVYPYTMVCSSVSHPPGAAFPSSIARQPRRCQYGTIRLRKALDEMFRTPTFVGTDTVPTAVEASTMEKSVEERGVILVSRSLCWRCCMVCHTEYNSVQVLLHQEKRCQVDYSTAVCASFLLVRCVHSPGATRVLLANKIIVPFQTQETKPNPKKNEDMGTFVRFWSLFFCKLTVHIVVDRGIRNGETKPESELCKQHTIEVRGNSCVLHVREKLTIGINMV